MACSDGSQDFNSFIEEIFIVIYYILFIMVTEEVEVWLEVLHSAGAVNNDETLDHIRRHRGKQRNVLSFRFEQQEIRCILALLWAA